MKLLDIIKELEKPKNVYAPGMEPNPSSETDFLKKGFKLSNPTIDPETGASMTSVEYLPAFETVRRQILKMRKEFQPFRYAADENVAKVAKEINTNMTKLSQLIFALDKMVELQRKNK